MQGLDSFLIDQLGYSRGTHHHQLASSGPLCLRSLVLLSLFDTLLIVSSSED